jgi:hypothetical protein
MTCTTPQPLHLRNRANRVAGMTDSAWLRTLPLAYRLALARDCRRRGLLPVRPIWHRLPHLAALRATQTETPR